MKVLQKSAHTLSQQSGAKSPFSLALMTDEAALPNPTNLIPHLPKGCAVIYRHYFVPKRELLAKRLCALCKAHGLLFLVAGNVALARTVRADGLHLPSWLLARPGLWRGFAGVISAACHTREDLKHAQRHGVNAALVSPVWPTQSHQNAKTLGPAGLKAMARDAQIPILALGGVTPQNASSLQGVNIAGFAAITAFVPPSQ